MPESWLVSHWPRWGWRGFLTDRPAKTQGNANAGPRANEPAAVLAAKSAGGLVPLLRGDSQATLELRRQIDKIAPRAVTVLINGETGVGKEMAAREIHARSRRVRKPFVPVDCTAFSSQLIESQLFGHVRGAFTGAVGAALGFIRCANGGTLFLDEIGELPPSVQAKLLRCLQERAVVPVGGVEPIAVDLRVVAATHRDLARMVREGSFRQDLYFRLNVVRLTIPPLRERRDDIVPLARYFLEELAEIYDEPRKLLGSYAQDVLVRYEWPGNVRELRNAMERAFLFCGERTIEPAHLPSELTDAGESDAPCGVENGQRIPSLVEAEAMLIARVLRVSGGNQSEASRLLKVERHRLRRMIENLGLTHLLPRPPLRPPHCSKRSCRALRFAEQVAAHGQSPSAPCQAERVGTKRSIGTFRANAAASRYRVSRRANSGSTAWYTAHQRAPTRTELCRRAIFRAQFAMSQ